ncbi:exopolysaccharide biosynthesis polyprenyl glycosylphosphotransferase [Mycobacterium sp. JS623]|uniref:sugar transferase n=1 Tax=Mycobacterium sp. JS623 TaxID=212767 RepID=UPI0002A5800B|nr:sugar transferase [Mycobacterium sp. JS623]AGB21751.1 exopolysaccharide biosynthesis polyprenyl glycosylphosphotransferase [Mycobacterium sp. JS623]
MSTAIDLNTPAHAELQRRPAASRRVWQRRYELVLRFSDTGVVMAAVVAGQWLRFGAVPGVGAEFLDWRYWATPAAVVSIWVLFLTIYRAREPRILGAGPEEYRRVAAATFSAFGAIAIFALLFRLDFARGYLAIALPLGLIGLLASRRMARQVVAGQRRRRQCLTSVLIVGAPGPALGLVRSLARTPEYGYEVVGVCHPGQSQPGRPPHTADGVPVYTHNDDLVEIIEACGADTVALTATDRLEPHEIGDLSWQLEKLDIDLVVSPGMVGLAGPRLTMRPVADLPLIHVDKPQYDGAKRFEKRAFDVCFSIMVLSLALPILVAAAVAVKLTSKGPIFYKSDRIGMDGNPFSMLKIRTMVEGADAQRPQLAELNEVEGGVIFKMRRDPRVTPVGRFLRRYSIDELPQFVNVLRREMSVVGPRPPLPSEVEAYDDRVRRRLLVRPGITGLWQISGRSDLSWDDFVRLDLSYVENWSMISDLLIAAKTVRAVFSGTGAY